MTASRHLRPRPTGRTRLGTLAVALTLALVAVAPASGAGTSPAPAGPDGTSASGGAGATPAWSKTDLSLPHLPDVVLVGFRPRTSPSARVAARALLGATARQISELAADAERWTLPPGRDIAGAIAALATLPSIRYAEPAWIVTAGATSNDPAYTDGTLWGMHGDGISPRSNPFGSGADEAWARGYTGSSAVYVGIIDTGVQYTHPDLAANVWTNAAEASGRAGVDDDGNGRIDDLHGWDFYDNDASVFDADEHFHGTHVAGTIGGIGGNGRGVAGVNWQVRLISAKFLGPTGSGSIDAAAAALDYLTTLKLVDGLNIVASSNSWGGGGFSQTMLDAIERSGDAGILFLAAAGNGASDNDAAPFYPSSYRCTLRGDTGAPRGWDCVVSVAAIDAAGARASFSNWGATTVDLGAPGVGIYSTYPVDGYGLLDGTSMATPHVSGAAALCAAINPARTALGIRLALLNSAMPTTSLAGRTVTGGRLDVGRLVDACLPSTAAVSGTVTNLAVRSTGTRSVDLGWTSTASNESAFEVQAAPSLSGICGTFGLAATLGADATSGLVTDLSASTDYCLRVRASNDFSGGSVTAWSSSVTARTADLPAPYVCAPATYAWVDPAGGTSLTLTDDATSTRTLPFTFTSYGTSYTQATVSSNGFIRLGSSAVSAFSNLPIPDASEPNALLAPAWDDWNPGAGGTVSVRTTGTSPSRRWVVTWANVPSYNVVGSAVSFQAILEEGGDVVRFQYLDMLTGNSGYDSGASATAGIEGPTGEDGTQIGYLTKTLLDGTAFRCSAGATLPTTPLAMSTTSLPAATAGSAYSTTLAATGGIGPYAWSLSGSLPSGIAFDPAGAFSGTPAQAGSFPLTVTVRDATGGTVSRAMTLAVGFGKASPLNGAKFPNTTRSVTLAWLPHLAAAGAAYRWCAAASNKGCSTWSDATSATSATIVVGAGQTWSWQAQVLLGATWTAANGGTVWKFSTAR